VLTLATLSSLETSIPELCYPIRDNLTKVMAMSAIEMCTNTVNHLNLNFYKYYRHFLKLQGFTPSDISLILSKTIYTGDNEEIEKYNYLFINSSQFKTDRAHLELRFRLLFIFLKYFEKVIAYKKLIFTNPTKKNSLPNTSIYCYYYYRLEHHIEKKRNPEKATFQLKTYRDWKKFTLEQDKITHDDYEQAKLQKSKSLNQSIIEKISINHILYQDDELTNLYKESEESTDESEESTDESEEPTDENEEPTDESDESTDEDVVTKKKPQKKYLKNQKQI
jgi:hypothetical protein